MALPVQADIHLGGLTPANSMSVELNTADKRIAVHVQLCILRCYIYKT